MTTRLFEPDETAVPEEFAGGQMTLLEHLLELRYRITWMAVSVVLGMVAFFIPQIGFRVIGWLLLPAQQAVPDFRPQFIEPMENIAAFFQVALLGGLTVSMPFVVYHALRFITPALTRNEKKWVFPIVFGASAAFVGGVAFGYFFILPFTLTFLLTFGNSFAEADWRIGNYIDFVTRMLGIMGLVFETPLLVMALARFHVVRASQLLHFWRYAVIIAFVIAAIVTPTIDPVTQTLVGGPIVILYFIGIGLAWLVRRD